MSLLTTGTPSILVPSPNVAEDHQTKNAQSMQEMGASVFITDEQLERDLVPLIQQILSDRSRRRQMSVDAKDAARPDAARDIARSILQLLNKDKR